MGGIILSLILGSIPLLLWFGFAWVTGKWAEEKGRQFFPWFLVGLLFNPISFIIVWAMTDITPVPPPPAPMLPFPCPSCGALVQPTASSCPCGQQITEEERAAGMLANQPKSRLPSTPVARKRFNAKRV